MKYRLKKDLPWAKAGSEWESARDICAESIGMGCLDLPGHVEFIPKSTFSDWFEPIEKRWKPKVEETFWALLSHFEPVDFTGSSGSSDDEYVNVGNCFRTREQAEEAVRRMKEVLMKYHNELNK